MGWHYSFTLDFSVSKSSIFTIYLRGNVDFWGSFAQAEMDLQGRNVSIPAGSNTIV